MIGIIGATGFTGKLVADELIRRKANFFIAGRNAQSLRDLSKSLNAVPYRVIDVQDSATFNALEGCTLIINCAGPFTDFGEAIVQEAIARRAHYLDTTGEQGFIKLVYDKYHEQAKAVGIVLVPSCAYEYAIGDAIGAQLIADFPQCQSIEMIYDMEEMHTSPGTRKSVVRAVTAPGFSLKNGLLVEGRPAAITRKIQLNGKTVPAMSFPSGEALMLPRHTDVQNVDSFMTAKAPLFILQTVAALGQSVMQIFGDFIVNKMTTGAPTLAQRQNSTFLIQARTKIGSEAHSITVTGKDPYLLTAVIISEAALRLHHNIPVDSGAITPAMIGGADLIRKLLEDAGAKWFSTSGSFL